MAVGFEPGRFWHITPKEVDREMLGARKRFEREADERMSLAWHIVALDRTKKLPKLETLLISGKKSRRKLQTPEDFEALRQVLHAGFRGKSEELKTIQ